jgi:predicted ABC-type ATPase
MTNLEYLIAAEEGRKQRAAKKKAKPQRGNFLNRVQPPKALPGSTSTFGSLLEFPKFEETEKRRQKFGAGDYGLAAAKALEEPGLANRAATGLDPQMDAGDEQLGQRLRKAAKPNVDKDLAGAMASFDRENPRATPEQREMVKYRVQGMLAMNSPALGQAAERFKMDVARGADPWEAAKKHAPAYFRDLQETTAGQAVLKPLREFNQKAGTIASELVLETSPVSALPREQAEPFVRPIVRTAAALANPGTYLEQVLTNAHDPEAAKLMLDSYTALLDPKKPLEDKVQSALTWGLTLFGLSSAPGMSAGKGTRAMAEGATTKAIEILQEAPETPETAAALQKLNTAAADWDGFWNGQSKALDAPQRPPSAESPTIAQPGKELGAQAAGRRRPFSEDRAVAAFEQKVLATGKVDADQARAVAETVRARARSHEAMTGQGVQHFWEELVPEFRTMDEAAWRAGRDRQGALLQPEQAPKQGEPGWATFDIDTPERLQLRDEVKRRLYGAGAKAKDKKATLVIGGSGSGKSTLAEGRYLHEDHALLIDADLAKRELPEFAEQDGASRVHVESNAIVDDVLEMAVESGDSIVKPMTGSDYAKTRQLVEQLRARGYAVRVVLVDLPADEAVRRIDEIRVKEEGGMPVPEKVTRDSNRLARETYNKLKAEGLADEFARFDNNVPRGARPRIAEREIGPVQRLVPGAAAAREHLRGGRRAGGDVPAGLERPDQSAPASLAQETLTGSAAKGAVEFGEAGRAVITLFEAADVTTIMHELAHTWRRQLAGEDMLAVRDWLGADESGRLTRAQEERFARATERYLMTGKAPSAKLQWAFDKFRDWFRQIYVSVKASKQIDVRIPREVREVFDRMFDEDLARSPRRKEIEALSQRREELAKVNPEDPRLDPFSDQFDPRLADEIRDELGSAFGENLAPHQILEEIQTRLWESHEEMANQWDAGTRAEYLSYVKGVRSDQAKASLIRWSFDAKRKGWYPDYRQRVGDINISHWPEDLQRAIESYRDAFYNDPEYRLLSEAKSRQLSGGMSRPPDGSYTVSEFAQKEGSAIGDSAGKHSDTYPVPLVQDFAQFLESGGTMAKTLDSVIKDLDDEAMYSRAEEEAGIAPKGEIEEVAQGAVNRDYQRRMQELDTQAQREKWQRDQAEILRKQAERIRNGEETLLERRAREAAERLAERKENTGPTKAKEVEQHVEDTETLFQEDAPLDPQTFEDVRDVAAGMLEREVSDQRVYEAIRARYKLTPAQAKDAMRSARKLIRILKAEEEIPKAAPRILELDEAGLGFKDISRVLGEEFPQLTKNRHKRAWAQALEGAGKPVASPAGERRYTFIKSEIDRATVRIQDMEASGKPFFEISEMLTDEYPAIPKTYHEEAFAKAMANKEDWVVTRIDDKGHIKVFMGGRSVTVPLATVADIEQWSSVNWKGFKTESRLVDQLSGRNQQLRSWLIENREKAVTSMVKERGAWRAQLLEEPAIAWLRKDKKASELVQKYGEGVIGLDELKLQRPDDWRRVIEADTWFRIRYEEMLERANDTLKKLGQKPIPYRKNYYTHFQERGNLWQRLMGDDSRRGGIMTEILDVGTARTSQGRRNSPWNPFAQKRLKKEADVYDALGAFEAYLDPTLAQIHLTKPAMRRRVLARVLEEKAEQLKDQSTEGQSFEKAAEAASDFAYILNSQADALVGQRGAFDKAVDNQAAMAKPIGPAAVKGLQWLARRAAASKIVGSIRTAVMQTSGLALAVPELGNTNLAIAAMEQVRAMFAGAGELKGLKADPALAKSDFLARRYAETGPVRETMARRMVEMAAMPMEFIEQNVAETIWRAAYDRARLQSDGAMGAVRGGLGLGDEAAVAYADRIAERILAGRAAGERPMMFNTQAGKILYQFQLEQGNFLQFLGDDFWHDNGRRISKGEATWKGAKLMGALYVLNTVYEQLFGANPLPDPIRTAEDEFEILTSELDPMEKAARASGRLGGEALSAVPGGSTAAALIPEYDILGTGISRRELLGDTEAGTFAGGVPAMDTFKKLLSDEFFTVIARDLILPAGGTQLQRIIRGVDAITEGALSKPVSKRESWWQEQVYELVRSGAYDPKQVEINPLKPPNPEDLLERLARRRKFKIETPIDKARALIFGPTATGAARDYYQKEYKKTLAPVPNEIRVKLRLPG